MAESPLIVIILFHRTELGIHIKWNTWNFWNIGIMGRMFRYRITVRSPDQSVIVAEFPLSPVNQLPHQ
jgi:hypothetical protein